MRYYVGTMYIAEKEILKTKTWYKRYSRKTQLSIRVVAGYICDD